MSGRFLWLLLKRAPALHCGLAVIVILGVQLAVRPDKWLGSYHLVGTTICLATTTITAGAVAGIAAAGAIVRGRRNLRGLDHMAARPSGSIERMRLFGCLVAVTLGYVLVVGTAELLSASRSPGSRLGSWFVLAGWINLVVMTAVGFGIGRIAPHPATPPLVFVMSSLLIGFRTRTGTWLGQLRSKPPNLPGAFWSRGLYMGRSGRVSRSLPCNAYPDP